jgi:hypothetical protein
MSIKISREVFCSCKRVSRRWRHMLYVIVATSDSELCPDYGFSPTRKTAPVFWTAKVLQKIPLELIEETRASAEISGLHRLDSSLQTVEGLPAAPKAKE